MKSHVVYGTLMGFVVVIMCALAVPGSASDIGGVVKSACTRCHSSKRICLNVGVKSNSLWKATVMNMVRKGAKLPADQVGAAVNYLTNLKPGQGPLCQ